MCDTVGTGLDRVGRPGLDEVDPSVGGRGIGTTLVSGVLAAARERGLTVLPYCSFIRHYIQQHPEETDLVAVDDRPHFGLETVDR